VFLFCSLCFCHCPVAPAGPRHSHTFSMTSSRQPASPPAQPNHHPRTGSAGPGAAALVGCEQWMRADQLPTATKKRLEQRLDLRPLRANVFRSALRGPRSMARVQGTEAEPYKVKLCSGHLFRRRLGLRASSARPEGRWSAQLLAGD